MSLGSKFQTKGGGMPAIDPVVEFNAHQLTRRLGPRAKRFVFQEEQIIVIVAGVMASIIGHGNGKQIGKTTLPSLVKLLHENRCLVGVEIVFLASCWSGKDWVAETLRDLLHIEVWAPITPVKFTDDGFLRALEKDPEHPRTWLPTDPRDVAKHWRSWPVVPSTRLSLD
jgi:hypothetical protein